MAPKGSFGLHLEERKWTMIEIAGRIDLVRKGSRPGLMTDRRDPSLTWP